jgi:hypothetical protein
MTNWLQDLPHLANAEGVFVLLWQPRLRDRRASGAISFYRRRWNGDDECHTASWLVSNGSTHCAAAGEIGIQWARCSNAMLVGLGIIDEPTICKPTAVPPVRDAPQNITRSGPVASRPGFVHFENSFGQTTICRDSTPQKASRLKILVTTQLRLSPLPGTPIALPFEGCTKPLPQ